MGGMTSTPASPMYALAMLTIFRHSIGGSFGWLASGVPWIAFRKLMGMTSTPKSRSMNIMVLMILASIAGAFVNGTFAFVTADLFPTRIRFSGVALVQNISQTAFGGTAPLVATALIRNLQSPVAPALVVVVCGVMTFVGSFYAARRPSHGRVGAHAAALS